MDIEFPPLPDVAQVLIQGRIADRLQQYAKEAVELDRARRAAHPADAGAVAVERPIQMILHCPKCGLQHIDATEFGHRSDLAGTLDVTWTNPPHRSHLCHGCSHIWRPADVPTEGVRAIETHGKADSPLASQPQATPLEATSEQHALELDDRYRKGYSDGWTDGHHDLKALAAEGEATSEMANFVMPTYTPAPPLEWDEEATSERKPLTMDEIRDIWNKTEKDWLKDVSSGSPTVLFVRAIEQHHGIHGGGK